MNKKTQHQDYLAMFNKGLITKDELRRLDQDSYDDLRYSKLADRDQERIFSESRGVKMG